MSLRYPKGSRFRTAAGSPFPISAPRHLDAGGVGPSDEHLAIYPTSPGDCPFWGSSENTTRQLRLKKWMSHENHILMTKFSKFIARRRFFFFVWQKKTASRRVATSRKERDLVLAQLHDYQSNVSTKDDSEWLGGRLLWSVLDDPGTGIRCSCTWCVFTLVFTFVFVLYINISHIYNLCICSIVLLKIYQSLFLTFLFMSRFGGYFPWWSQQYEIL